MTHVTSLANPSPSSLALRVSGLRVETSTGAPIIHDVSFDLARREILGIVGESGSGKTTCALATLGMAHPGARLRAGTLTADGRTIEVADAKAAAALRGRTISYVPQSPGTALNPAMRIRTSLHEMLRRGGAAARHGGSDGDEVIRAALEKVHLPGTMDFLRRFPHQLSGGQQQRICIAMALLSGAQVVILDEPTTGLDVITQESVIAELRRLRRDLGLSMLYISHDLAVVSQIADRVAVMYCGSIVELGPVGEVLRSPSHPYTRGLLASTLDFRHPTDVRPMPGFQLRSATRDDSCTFVPRCSQVREDCRSAFPPLRRRAKADDRLVRCYHPVDGPREVLPRLDMIDVPAGRREAVLSAENLTIEYAYGGRVVASVNDVSFRIEAGQCLALLGESGSGKSTIARSVVGLKARASGSIRLNGAELAPHVGDRSHEQRRRLQMVFQNSSAALNPRETVRTAIERGRVHHGSGAGARVEELLERVRLPHAVQDRFPRELSGGERQRVCIARALASSPDVLVCDEITSALDVSVQAAVLKLMKDLQRELGLALLFITHDMGVVSYLADMVVVLDRGRVCESGPALRVLDAPQAAYSQRLMQAVPILQASAPA